MKAALFASLTPRELELVLIAANRDHRIFGGPARESIKVTLVTVTKKLNKAGRTMTKVTENMTRTPEQKVLAGLVRKGWLRFADMGDGLGYYYVTDQGSKALEVLKEGKNPLVK